MSSSQENCTNCDEKHQSRLLSRINDTSSCTKWVPTIFYPILGMLWSKFPFVALNLQAHKINDTAASSCIARRPFDSLPRDQTVIWARHSKLSISSKLHLLFSQLMHSLLWLINSTWATQKPFDHSGRCIIEDCQCWSWLYTFSYPPLELALTCIVAETVNILSSNSSFMHHTKLLEYSVCGFLSYWPL